MKVHFKHPRKIDQELFVSGLHNVPDHFSDHWYFKILVGSGDVDLLEPVKAGSGVSTTLKDDELEMPELKKMKRKGSR